jgi:hypothetical protein
MVGDQLAVKAANDGGMGADEVNECLHLHAFLGNLRAHSSNCSSIRGR